ncbi:MAG: hypothetical protein Q8R26_03290 [bacterium]|nr:hypothetical protein [bacterium]
MFKHAIKFLMNLREKDESTRKRWFVGLSAFAGLFVVSLWSVYFTANVQSVTQHTKEKQSASDTGLFVTMINGVKVLTRETGNQVSQVMAQLGSLVQQTNSVTIQQPVPSEEPIAPNFFAQHVDPVPVQKLP